MVINTAVSAANSTLVCPPLTPAITQLLCHSLTALHACSMVFVAIRAQNNTCSVQSYIAAVGSFFYVACRQALMALRALMALNSMTARGVVYNYTYPGTFLSSVISGFLCNGRQREHDFFSNVALIEAVKNCPVLWDSGLQ